MRKRIGVTRRVLFVAASLIMIGIVAYFYVHKILLPIKIKQFVEHKSHEYFNRPITVGKIKYQLVKGFTISDIKIYRKDDRNKLFVEIKKASFNVLIAPAFKYSKIIIPTLKISNPFLYLAREEKNLWNISDLKSLKKETRGDTAYPVILKNFILENGEVNFIDKTKDQLVIESIKRINLDAAISIKKSIKWNFRADIPQRKAKIVANGDYLIDSKTFNAHLQAQNIPLAEYINLFTPQTKIDIKEGLIPSADLTITHNKQGIKLSGALELKQINIITKDKNSFNGDLSVTTAEAIHTNNQWLFKGHLSSPAVEIKSAGQYEYQGLLDATIDSLVYQNKNFTVKGQLVSNNSHLTFQDNKAIHGDLTVSDINLTKTKDTFKLDASYILNNANIKIADTFSLTGNINLNQTSLIKKNDDLDINGQVTIGHAHIVIDPNTAVKGELSTTATRLNYSDKKFELKTDLLLKEADIKFGENHRLSGEILAEKIDLAVQNKSVNLESKLQVIEADVTLTSETRFLGNPQLHMNYRYEPDADSLHQYAGTLELSDASLSGIPAVNKIQHIKGKLLIKNDHVLTQLLSLKIQDSDIRLSGFLTDFDHPKVEITTESDNIELSILSQLFAETLKHYQIDISGKARLTTHYKGSIAKPSKADIQVEADVADSHIIFKKFSKEATGISGKIKYTANNVTWENLKGIFESQTYTLNGKLENFSRPVVKTQISSENIELATDVKILRNAYHITALKGSYYNSSINISGILNLTKDDNPLFNINGVLGLDLQDLPRFIPSIKDRINTFTPIGRLSIEGIFKGPDKDWRNWTLALKAQSPQIVIKNYPLQNVVIQYQQRDRYINQFDINASLYDGQVTLKTSADLSPKDLTIKTSFLVKQLDLTQLRKDQNFKAKDFAGKLSLAVNMEGPASQLGQMTGTGEFQITEGYLWHLIPQYYDTIFTDAKGSFTIQDSRLLTEDTQLMSKFINFNSQGWIDFDGNLMMDIVPVPANVPVIEFGSTKIDASILLKQVVRIKCEGKIKKPNCAPEISARKVIKSTSDVIKGIGSILVDIINN